MAYTNNHNQYRRPSFSYQNTQPIPVVPPFYAPTTPNEYYRRLKEIADATGERFLFVYLRYTRGAFKTPVPSRARRG